MADNWAENLRNVEYNNNVTHELQQEPGILYPLAGSSDNYAGSKAARIESRFAALQLQKKTTRNGDTNNVDPSTQNRFVRKPGSSNVAPLIDRDDVNATSVEMKAPLIMSTAQAARQYHDDQFVRGWWGSGFTGEAGEIEVAFPAANKVPVNYGGAGAVGITRAKLVELRRLMRKANVNFKAERPIILLDADAEADLFSIPEYINFDFNDSKVLVDGEVKPWMGFRFLQANLGDPTAYPDSAALLNVGGVNRLPVIVPSGIHRAVWVEFWGKIDARSDKQYSEQIYAEAESTAVRTDEKKAWFIETKPAA
jgi:hypothetical protein